MAKFFPINSQVLEDHLKRRGFTAGVQYREVVYAKRSTRNPDVQVKVYTSIRTGASQVRGSGKDAIRVCAVFDDGRRSFGIGKFPPVLRVDSEASILARLDERIRAAAARVTEWIDQQAEARAPRQPHPDESAMDRIASDAERASEVRGFSSDPDFRDFIRDSRREETYGHAPPEWLCDPCSEPPPAYGEP